MGSVSRKKQSYQLIEINHEVPDCIGCGHRRGDQSRRSDRSTGRSCHTADMADTVTATVALWLLILKDKSTTMELTTVIPDTMDMVTDMAALLLLIPRDRKATTVDTTVADTVTATADII